MPSSLLHSRMRSVTAGMKNTHTVCADRLPIGHEHKLLDSVVFLYFARCCRVLSRALPQYGQGSVSDHTKCLWKDAAYVDGRTNRSTRKELR